MYLQVLGAKDIYSLGDCATIAPKKLVDNIKAIFDEADVDHDGTVTLKEFKEFTGTLPHTPVAEGLIH